MLIDPGLTLQSKLYTTTLAPKCSGSFTSAVPAYYVCEGETMLETDWWENCRSCSCSNKTLKLIGDQWIQWACLKNKRSIPVSPWSLLLYPILLMMLWCHKSWGPKSHKKCLGDATAPIVVLGVSLKKKPLDESYLIVLTLLIPIRINSIQIQFNKKSHINIVIQVP